MAGRHAGARRSRSQANTTYVVSYGTTQNYAYTSELLRAPRTRAGRGADRPRSGASGGNGVFANGGTGRVPDRDLQRVELLGRRHLPAHARHARRSSPRRRASAPRRTRCSPARSPPPTPTATPSTYAIVGGADSALFAHQRRDRCAALPHRARLRGAGGRRRQQRLQPHRQRLRRQARRRRSRRSR